MTNADSRPPGLGRTLNRLTHALHEGASVVPPAQFRGWALREVQQLLGFSGAAWGTGSRTSDRIHVLQTFGSMTITGGSSQTTGSLATFLGSAARALPGEAQLLRSPTSSLQIAELEAASQLVSFISLTRGVGEASFTDPDRLALELVAPHLHSAWRVCQLLHLYARAAAAEGRGNAIVDNQGFVHVVDRKFYALLRSGWPTWSGPCLPSPLRELAEQQGTAVCGNVEWQFERTETGLYLSGRPIGQLGRLTPREHVVARGIIDGQSYAASAVQLGISINTVRNTVVRIYRKLGVSNKLELAKRAEFASAAETSH